MSSILIKGVSLNGKATDILIKGNRFSRIAPSITENADQEIDGKGFAINPPFYNGHCHAAMTLLRSYADDLPLFTWLNDHIWPVEDQMVEEDIYVGTKLALLEMIKSGTVFFNDMYGMVEESIKACEEMGVRAQIGISLMDRMGEESINGRFAFLHSYKSTELVKLAVAPHAPYTVSKELFERCVREADKAGVMIHTHLSETAKEVDDCKAEHGMSPVEWLDSLGVLTDKTALAHVVHTSDSDADILAKRQCVIVSNPTSNMKLASGAFHTTQHRSRGSRVVLGTDGVSSNNNLDMMQEMKFFALLAKLTEDAESAPADYVFDMATRAGAEAFGIDAGVIAEGKLADAVLVDMSNERLVPDYNLISNLVYSADSRCIDTVICNGRVVMRSGVVPGEDKIIEDAHRVCARFKAMKK